MAKQKFTNQLEQELSFSGGMAKNTSRAYLKGNTYYHGENGRLMSNNDNEFLDYVNIDGTKFAFKVPDIAILVDDDDFDRTFALTFTIVTNVTTYNYSVASKTYTALSEVYAEIIANFDPTNVHFKFEWDRASTMFLYCVQNTEYITAVSSSWNMNDTIKTGYKINASTNIREKLILFTTTNYDETPTDQDAIWEMTFNNVATLDLIPVVTNRLLFAGILNQSLYYPLDVKADYERSDLSKIYFTDYYNYPRTLNTTVDNFQYTADQFNFINKVEFSRVQIKSVNSGGGYKCGMVSYCYQLFRKYGQSTIISEITSPLHLSVSPNDSGYTDKYKGGAALDSSNKSVTIQIDNIDIRFYYIRVLAIYYDTETTIPRINIIKQLQIPPTSSIIIVDDGINMVSTYTLVDLISFGQTLTKCKHLAIKDRRLFELGIKEEYFDVDFDARAFRFKKFTENRGYQQAKIFNTSSDSTEWITIGGYGIGQTIAKDQGGTTLGAWAIPETYDCILAKTWQRDWGTSSVAESEDGYCFMSNGTRYGGTGLNVEYRFRTIPIKEDDNEGGNRTLRTGSSTVQSWSTVLDEYYDNNYGFGNYASPINDTQIKGFQRDEVYRVGLRLINTLGQRSFVKWIGDIKFPSMLEVDLVNQYNMGYPIGTVPAQRKDFALSFVGDDNSVFMNQLGLEIKVSNLPDDIVGYEIVYVKRQDRDKTIVAQGMLHSIIQAHLEDGSSSPAYCIWRYPIMNTPEQDTHIPDDLVCMHSPEITFNNSINTSTANILRAVGGYSIFSTNDSEDILQTLPLVAYTESPVEIVTKFRRVVPLYAITSPHKRNASITEVKLLTMQSNPITVGGKLIHAAAAIDGVGIAKYGGFKGTGLIFQVNSNILPFPDLAATGDNEISGDTDFMLVNYERDLPSQYGGLTYEDRSNNIYQSTGKVILAKEEGSWIPIFGGDTYVQMFDYLNSSAYVDTADIIFANKSYQFLHALYFPVETCINLAMRHDTCYSKYSPVTGASAHLTETMAFGLEKYGASYEADKTDLYLYNKAYSRGNDVVPIISKPLFFVNSLIYDDRIKASNYKSAGEVIDNWCIYEALNYKDVESAYGPIRGAIFWRNKLFVFQDHAICIPSINDRSLVKDNMGNDVVLGSTGLLERVDYITIDFGCVHKDSIIPGEKALYFFDPKSKSICTVGESVDNISDKLELKPWLDRYVVGNILNNTNSHVFINGALSSDGANIYGTFDRKFKEVLMTFKNAVYGPWDEPGVYSYQKEIYTISISETVGVANGFFSYDTPLYIQTWNDLLLVKRDILGNMGLSDDVHYVNIGEKGNILDVVYPWKISLMINKGYPITKVIDNISLIMNCQTIEGYNIHDEFFDTIRALTDYQNSSTLTFKIITAITDTKTASQWFAKRSERTWNFSVPENALKYTPDQMKTRVVSLDANTDTTRTFKDRMRDKTIIIELSYSNAHNYALAISGGRCEMRISFK